MLIGFIGLPNSGKTTIAAKVFSSLKETASNAELIVEQARFYIAKKRKEKNISLKDKVPLDDDDQLKIAKSQNKIENLMVEGCDKVTYIISDSSILNTMLYVSDDLFNNQGFKEALLKEGNKYDLLIYCHPFDTEEFPSDPNRSHSKDDVSKLYSRSKQLLSLIKQNNNVKEILGTFPLDLRWKECYSTITNEHLKFIQRIEIT